MIIYKKHPNIYDMACNVCIPKILIAETEHHVAIFTGINMKNIEAIFTDNHIHLYALETYQILNQKKSLYSQRKPKGNPIL